MYIISKFKDYYDFIGKKYGEDKKFVWKRDLIGEDPEVILNRNEIIDLKLPYYLGYNELEKYDTRFIIICGKLFFVNKLKNSKTWSLYDCKNTEFDRFLNIKRNRNKFHYFNYMVKSIESYLGGFSDLYLNLCIKYKSPIIVYQNKALHTKSPILGDIIEFVVNYNAEQIYQDINYFITNQRFGNPDIDPPVTLENDIKISYHGFDEHSFRPKSRK